jgi:transmembrane sensor
MDKSYFLELLRKYRQGTASEEECNVLIKYYDLFDSEPDVTALFSEEHKDELKSQLHSSIWEAINKQEQRSYQRSVFRKWSAGIGVAATIIAIFSIALMYYYDRPAQGSDIVYRSRSSHTKEHRVIRLPDGSTVIINSGSKLNYPSSFDGLAKREVYLEGQAYFDIKHNDSKPFIVHTGNVQTTVMGTAFNVKAWPGEKNVIVTVTRGKVRVGDDTKTFGVITPDQQITYNKEKDNVVQKVVDAPTYLAWKEQDLLFDDVTVAEAAELLQERFKVNISYADESIRSKRFTTTFLKDESLDQVLRSICDFNNASYIYNKEKATVVISNSK